jgi:LPXTG-motif cell wall-anchored protein
VFVRESVAFSFNLNGDDTGSPPDTTKPVMTAPNNMTVNTSQTSGSITVHYEPPTATDNRDGTLFPRCTPGTGTSFGVATTTTVTCTASDAAGNSTTITFTITVRISLPIVTVSTNRITSQLGGFRPRSTTLLTVFSDPRVLAEVVTDETGAAEYLIDVPTDLPPGPHTITIFGTGADGAAVLWVVPIVIAADGTLSEVRVGEGNAVPVPAAPPAPFAPAAPPAPAGPGTTPVLGPLPETGSTPMSVLPLAMALVLFGLVVWGGSRRRRITDAP